MNLFGKAFLQITVISRGKVLCYSCVLIFMYQQHKTLLMYLMGQEQFIIPSF
jgi:hypothetical protein